MTSPFDTSRPLAVGTHPGLFDTNLFGGRASTFRFDLIGVDGVYEDPLNPIKESPPILAHDTGRTVKRTLSLTLGVSDAARFDPVRHRVEPVMIMGDANIEFPLGRYMSIDNTRPESTGGDQASLMLTDELTQIAQQLTSGFSAVHSGPSFTAVADGRNIRSVIRALLDQYTLFNPRVGQGAQTTGPGGIVLHSGGSLVIETDIDSTPYTTSNAWQAGTSGAQVLEDLAVSGDYFSPWIGNDKTFRMIRTFDPADVVPLSDWDSTNAVIRGSVTRSDDLLTAPNRFVVISNQGGSASDSPIVGRYDVPASAPWSIRNRGFVVPQVTDMQLLGNGQAAAAARTLGIRQTVFERTTMSTPPDPRHDSYDVILWRGARWLELAWSLTLLEGAPMQHTVRRVFEDAGQPTTR